MRRSWGYIFLQLRPISTWPDHHMCRWVDNTSEITRDWGLLECVPLTRSVPWRTDAMEDRIPTFTHSLRSLAQMLGGWLSVLSLRLSIRYRHRFYFKSSFFWDSFMCCSCLRHYTTGGHSGHVNNTVSSVATLDHSAITTSPTPIRSTPVAAFFVNNIFMVAIPPACRVENSLE